MVKVRLNSALREDTVEKATQKSTLKGMRKDVFETISNNPNVTIPQIVERLGMNPRSYVGDPILLVDFGQEKERAKPYV